MGPPGAQHGDAIVRTRADGATELRINGVFVMDDQETSSERLLARRALATATRPQNVLVGGLGLGYTLRELLRDRRVRHVDVSEIEPAVVSWLRDGTLPGGDVLEDPRVAVWVGDVRDTVTAAQPGAYDLVLMDVDNGPDSRVYAGNAAVYEPPFLRRCAEALTDRGVLSVWSQADSPALREALATAFEQVTAERVPVRLQSREEAYWLLHGSRPLRSAS